MTKLAEITQLEKELRISILDAANNITSECSRFSDGGVRESDLLANCKRDLEYLWNEISQFTVMVKLIKGKDFDAET